MTATKRNMFSWLLVLLFAFYYVNITFFPHSHRIGDVVITHSHFYGGIITTSIPQHSHGHNEIVIINYLSFFLTAAIVFPLALVCFLAAQRYHYPVLAEKRTEGQYRVILQPRAPPALI
jgi:hypothetical protein